MLNTQFVVQLLAHVATLAERPYAASRPCILIT